MAYNVLPLNPDGEGHARFNLGNVSVELVTQFNYTIGAWSMDVLDANGTPLVCGLMLLPGFDLLKPYPDLKASIGGLMVAEQNEGDHQYPDLLGSTVQLLWFPVGTVVAFP